MIYCFHFLSNGPLSGPLLSSYICLKSPLYMWFHLILTMTLRYQQREYLFMFILRGKKLLSQFTRVGLDYCVQLLSRVSSICDLTDCSTPGFLVHHYLGVCSDSRALGQQCHPTISSSVTPFSTCSQSFPASVSFPMSRLLASDGQNIGAFASAPVLPMNIQGWFPLRLTGLIS